MNRINKLNFLAAAECTEEIIFPRVKRRLLQLKEESEKTFILPNDISEIYSSILKAKQEAIDLTKHLGMDLESYDDDYIIRDTEFVMELASQASLDTELDTIDEISDIANVSETSDEGRTSDEIALDQEETLSAIKETERLRLQKQGSSGMPIYSIIEGGSGKKFDVRHFVSYNGAYIRKSTALYVLQENTQLSNDRLLRVREDQPEHLYSGSSTEAQTLSHVIGGDLVVFRRIDDSSKMLLGRAVQFSYMSGRTKQERAYSSTYVDMGKDSFKKIGVFANWYARNDSIITEDTLPFKSVDDIFVGGYVSMENYVCTIISELNDVQESSFSIPMKDITCALPDWKISVSTYSEIFKLLK